MHETILDFYTDRDLLDRLSNAIVSGKKRIVFLVGSPISSPTQSEAPGVPGVNGIVEMIKSRFLNDSDAIRDLNNALSISQNPYQEAFRFLIGRRGPDAANSLIQQAVLSARTDGSRATDNAQPLLPEHCNILEKDADNWAIQSGLEALGKLITFYPGANGTIILTSNFDPLIEICVERAGGEYFQTILHRDGNIGQSKGRGCHVIHFHGYWNGADTLHTPRQLLQPRPQLKASLSSIIRDSLIVVMAYSGWDDIFTRTLVDVVNDDSSYPEIIWSFFSEDEEKIKSQQLSLLESLAPAIDRARCSLVKGVDFNSFMPLLLERVRSISTTNLGTAEIVIPKSEPAADIKYSPKPQALELVSNTLSDTPPYIDVWVGRENELQLLLNNNQSIQVISGIGGQGKSALASTLLTNLIEHGKVDFWDWRDCREEGDKLQTQLCAVIERLTDGQVTAAHLESSDVNAIVQLLGRLLTQKKSCIFVFDNIDYYVDLVTFEPIAELKVLINTVTAIKHDSRFIFTCRMNVKSENSSVFSLPLASGLSIEETKELFLKRQAKAVESCIERTHKITDGHPLWLNLLAVQVARGEDLNRLCNNIERGNGDLPTNTLDSIWTTLSDKHRLVLRTMAEMVRPEPEERILKFIGKKLTPQKFNKTIKALKAMNLVVIKPRPDSVDLLELHPLIREHIKTKYRRVEQEGFIKPIIEFYQQLTERLSSQLSDGPSILVLENWTYKSELELKRNNLKGAVQTLSDVCIPLLRRGYSEEFVRISRQVFHRVDWVTAISNYTGFDFLFGWFIKTLVHKGENAEVERFLNLYLSAMPGKNAQYICYCNLKCYYHWYSEQYAAALVAGKEGVELKAATKVDSEFDCRHNYALAQRDGGEVQYALKYFLAGKDLNDVLSSNRPDNDLGSAYYGNIGRCLYIMGKEKEAISLYRKSMELLEQEDHEHTQLNKGYARLWIAEAYERAGDDSLAAKFYSAAVSTWSLLSPPRAEKAARKLKALIPAGNRELVDRDTNPVELERFVQKWIKG